MPGAIVETWGRIWKHFQDPTDGIGRRYTHDLEIHDGEVSDPFARETDNGKWAFRLPGEDGALLSVARSWGWCQSFVVVFVPVGFELEVGGEVAVEVDLRATRETGEVPTPVHELSLLAGPSITFFGAGSVFFGACAPGPSSSNEPPGSEEPELGDCGRLAGATVELDFLHFLVGPEAWARAWRETRSRLGDGVAFELGIDLRGTLTILSGSLSLWIHYLAPKICWVRIFGRRVFPYICGFGCRKAAITIASFPGISWDLFDVELGSIEDWVGESQSTPCPGCPREE